MNYIRVYIVDYIRANRIPNRFIHSVPNFQIFRFCGEDCIRNFCLVARAVVRHLASYVSDLNYGCRQNFRARRPTASYAGPVDTWILSVNRHCNQQQQNIRTQTQATTHHPNHYDNNASSLNDHEDSVSYISNMSDRQSFRCFCAF